MQQEMEYGIQCNKKSHVFKMGMSAMRPSWTYKLGQNIISKEKEEKDLGMVIQNNLSPEKHR